MCKFYKPVKRLNIESNKKETFVAVGQYRDGHLVYVKIIDGIKDYDKMYIQIREDNKLKMKLNALN